MGDGGGRLVLFWSPIIQRFGEKSRNCKWKLRNLSLLIVGLFPRLPFLTMWSHCTTNILGVQNSSDIVMPPWKLAASVQPLVFILFPKNTRATDKLLIKERDFIPTALLPFVILYSRRGKTQELQAGQPDLDPWEGDGANNPGNCLETYERQKCDCK